MSPEKIITGLIPMMLGGAIMITPDGVIHLLEGNPFFAFATGLITFAAGAWTLVNHLRDRRAATAS